MTNLTDDERTAARGLDDAMRHLKDRAPGVDITRCGRCDAEILPGQALCAACAVLTGRVPQRSNAKLR